MAGVILQADLVAKVGAAQDNRFATKAGAGPRDG